MANFDEIISRRGTNSYKYDEDAPDSDTAELWVADMDFRTPEPIIRALHERVEHGIFGYTFVPESFYTAIIDWFSRRNSWTIERDWIQYTSGVVPAISAIIKGLTKHATTDEKPAVVVLTPVYNCFFSSIRNNDCQTITVPLLRTADSYIIDYEAFERACARPETKIFLLCNPHNPAGRVWTEEELKRLGDICIRHGVTVLSDEIHGGIVMPGYKFTPFGSLGKKYLDVCVTASSCTKSFNIAGLQIAYIICNNEEWRALIDRAINDNEVCDVNPFGVIALQAAYNECESWLGELNDYIYGNYEMLREYFGAELPLLRVMRLEGTYLAWVDCRALGISSKELGDRLLREGNVRVSSGDIYGDEGGYIRINMACPRAVLADGMKRIVDVLK